MIELRRFNMAFLEKWIWCLGTARTRSKEGG